jgi:hypothetical protein
VANGPLGASSRHPRLERGFELETREEEVPKTIKIGKHLKILAKIHEIATSKPLLALLGAFGNLTWPQEGPKNAPGLARINDLLKKVYGQG